MLFYDGTQHEEFEYLIALRYFDKYDTTIEINPKFIWYGNLVKEENGYVDSITDELIIKTSSNHIEVKRKYLKDFLCAINKICVIVFDHVRYFNNPDCDEKQREIISGKDYYMCFSMSSANGLNKNYDYYSSIIGKTVVYPFKKPRHKDYMYFTEDKEYENFIIDYDEDENEEFEFTCNEDKLANYFGANPDAPHFLTPVFFYIKVLDKYKSDPRNYRINDSNITYLSEWSIPFNINKNSKVSVWLGDLGRIPYEEQKYWKSFNTIPDGEMDTKFIDRQIKGIWTDASRIESKLVPSLNKLNTVMKEKFGGEIFNMLSIGDKEIYNTFMIPTNYSIPDYQSFLMKLSKLTSESINVKLIKNIMGDDYEKKIEGKGSISQLGILLKELKLDENLRLSNALKKAYNSRNKLAGHTASFSEYNKIWGREKDYRFNSVEDARTLIKEIVSGIEYVIANYEVKKDEITGNQS